MTKIIVAVLALVVLVFGGAAVLTKPTDKPVGAQSVQVTDGNCYFFNGLHTCPAKQTMNSATTTLCSFKSPNATSTLRGTAVFLLASSTATTFVIATSTSISASTTAISGIHHIPASTPYTAYSSTTPVTGGSDLQGDIIQPNTNVNFVLTGGDIGGMTGLAPSGDCRVEFTY